VTGPFQKINFHQAFAEVLLIAFGVLCALAAQSWWEARQEHEAEHQYLVALQQDLRSNLSDIEIELGYIQGVFDSVDKLLGIIGQDPSEPLPEDFSQSVGRAYFLYQSSLSSGTYDDLVNSGNLSLIRSDKLRRGLAAYSTLLAELDAGEAAIVEDFTSLQAPFLYRHFVATDFGWFQAGTDTPSRATRLIGLPPEGPFEVDEQAARSREFWNLAFDWRAFYSGQVILIVEVQQMSVELLAEIDSELQALGG
jgi:hypothetical protein